MKAPLHPPALTTLRPPVTPTLKILLGAALITALGGAAYQAREFRVRAAKIADIRQTSARWRQEVLKLERERTDALAAATVEELEAVAPLDHLSGDVAFDAQMRLVAFRVNQLKKYLAQNTREQIPQLRFLHDTDWFEVAQTNRDLSTSATLHDAMKELRSRARMRFSIIMASALKGYLAASGGELPTAVGQLVPYFVTPVEDQILRRYEIRATGKARELPEGTPVIAEVPDETTDDFLLEFPAASYGGRTPEFGKFKNEAYGGTASSRYALSKAIQAYRAANRGQEPAEARQLLPFFQTTTAREKFLQLHEKFNSHEAPKPRSLNEP